MTGNMVAIIKYRKKNRSERKRIYTEERKRKERILQKRDIIHVNIFFIFSSYGDICQSMNMRENMDQKF